MRQCLDARGVGAQKLFQRGRLPLQSRLERLRYAGRLAAEGSGHVVETLACPVGHVADRLGLRLEGLAQALRRLVSLMAQRGRDFLRPVRRGFRSEEHTSELQSLMRISYAVFCLKTKNKHTPHELKQSILHNTI